MAVALAVVVLLLLCSSGASPGFARANAGIKGRALLAAAAAKEADLVVDLPGQPADVAFKNYAGYVTVNASRGRALFYWFFEATSDPASKPLVLWLNGGPGCSSVGYGQSQELGPFRVAKDGASVFLNDYSWNQEANLLFLESPAGVGFSYSNTTTDYAQFGDTQTALDAYSFLVGWYERFPEYKKRPFYITGESYAGHYVPQLAKLIVDKNNPNIVLKGIMMGNAVIDDSYDTKGIVDYAWSHAIISSGLHQNFSIACNDYSSEGVSSRDCSSLFLSIFINDYSVLNIYSIYSDNCLNASNSSTRRPNINKKGASFPILSKSIPSMFSHPREGGYDPCIEDHVFTYLNRPDVQKALHAKKTNWNGCSSKLSNWTDSASSMFPTLKELTGVGLKIWYFSGDWDGRIPFLSTQYALDSLKLPMERERYTWSYLNQVGGWTQVYEGITFVIVRGAGHMVPSYQPGRALALFSQFLIGKPLPALNQ